MLMYNLWYDMCLFASGFACSFYIAEYFCILPKAIYLIKVALYHDLARYDDT